jgi:hypothetical protein
MYGYPAQDTTRKAPMILAGDITWFPATRRANEFPAIPAWAYVLVTLLVLFGTWGAWRLNQPDKTGERLHGRTGRNFDDFPPQEFLPVDPDAPSSRTDTLH